MKEVAEGEEDSSDISGYHSDSDSAIMMSGNSPYVSKRARYNFLSRSGKKTVIIIIIIIITQSVSRRPQPLPKRVFQRLQSRASAFKFRYLLFSLKSFSSCLRLLPPLPSSFISPSVACFRRQFLRKMWRVRLAFLHFILWSMFFSSSKEDRCHARSYILCFLSAQCTKKTLGTRC